MSVLGQFEVEEDHRQQVVEIMGNASHQNARGLQLVQNETILFGPLVLGDVLQHRAALLPRRRNRRFDPHLDRRLSFLEERHFADLPGLALEDLARGRR